MSEIFVLGDTHFYHDNILKFTIVNEAGYTVRLRPHWDDIEEMNEAIIDNWNHVVTVQDKVYHLGDVAMSKKGLELCGRLKGKKRLIRGNHDLQRTTEYLKYFKEVYGVRQINGVWLTHTPMHLHSVEQPRVVVNVHGHLHASRIKHPKYYNASCECVNYIPVSLDDIVGVMHDQYDQA